MNAPHTHDRYAQAALEAECAKLAGTARGRNDATNRSAFSLGQIVGAGALDRSEVEQRLYEACQVNGHVAKHGPAGTRATIASGLKEGQPRSIPETSWANGASRPKPQPAPARPQEPDRPAPKLHDVPIPNWTEPDGNGKLLLFAHGLDEPKPMNGEVRRHRYVRDGAAARIKIKKADGAWVDIYRVLRTADEVMGWQAKKPAGFLPMPYLGPAGAIDGFDPEMIGETLWWVEGERDCDTVQQVGLCGFTFGSASDVPDCRELLRGRDVVIVGDNDEAGEKGIARKVEMARGVVGRLRVVRFADLPAGGDVTDFLKGGGTVEALLARAVDVEAEAPKSEEPGQERFADAEPTRASTAPNLADLLTWYGDKAPEPPPWLVRDLVPRGQVAIVAGQFGAAKTFVVDDLSACVMLGTPFAGREVVEQGAVLWLAAEGASEVDVRIKAAATERNGSDPGLLPFARQSFDVPRLTAPDAEEQLLRLAGAFKEGLRVRFPGQELVMIVIDTLGSAAGWADANSSSEAQAVMNVLRHVNAKTGALILVVDHFGKVAETGVMGASAKPQSAEAILAVLSDRDMAGNHSNRRMAVAKLRSGASGAETAFKLRSVPIDEIGGTTCVIDWSSTLDGPAATKAGDAWIPSLGLFKACVGRVLLDHGEVKRPFGINGPEVRAVLVDKVRSEFVASYAAETPEAKRKQWGRVLKGAVDRDLVATRDLGGEQDWLWLTTKGAGLEP